MGHRSHSRSRESRERSSNRKRTNKRHTSREHSHSSKHKHRSRSRDRHYDREHKHRHTSERKKHEHSDSDDHNSENSDLRGNLESKDIQREFELSNFSKAYGLDLSGFVGLSSEILNATSTPDDKKLTRFERRKLRQHELKHHQERFWKCKKCEFMNYLSNYECKRCKGLRASCAT